MMVDRDLVTRKLLLILADLDRLEPVGASGVDAFQQDIHQQLVAERLLERMIGRMIDVNYHLLTQAGEAPPPDYHTSFERLAPLGVLDADFARRIARAAGLRNRLVHDYEDIDARRLHESLQPARNDIAAWVASVQRYLEHRPT
jgi:uncharacterized protein YutE (UPF0331/DUF86 family)